MLRPVDVKIRQALFFSFPPIFTFWRMIKFNYENIRSNLIFVKKL